MRIIIAIGVLVIYAGLISGCDNTSSIDTQNENDNNNQQPDENAWLIRVPIPDSTFKPDDIESTIEKVVEELNSRDQNTDLRVAVIPKIVSGYFAPAVLGANRAIGELGVLGSVLGPTEEGEGDFNTELQIEYMQSFVNEYYSGVGIAPVRGDLIEYIDAAVDSGMTVVTFDSDEPTSKRQIYIGTLNDSVGREGGQTLVDILDEQTGTVIVYGQDSEEWIDGYRRTQGAKEVLEAAGYTVIVRQADWSVPEEDVTAMKDLLLESTPEVVGMLGMFSNSHYCVDAAIAADMIQDVKIAAFDFESKTIEYLKAGHIQVTHGQRQYYMGYLIPYFLLASNMLGMEETKALFSDLIVDDDKVHTGLDIVSREHLEDYETFLSSLGIF